MMHTDVFLDIAEAVVNGKSYATILQMFSQAKERKAACQDDPVAWVELMAKAEILLTYPKGLNLNGPTPCGKVVDILVHPFLKLAKYFNNADSSSKTSESLKCQKLAGEMLICLFKSLRFGLCAGVSYLPEETLDEYDTVRPEK